MHADKKEREAGGETKGGRESNNKGICTCFKETLTWRGCERIPATVSILYSLTLCGQAAGCSSWEQRLSSLTHPCRPSRPTRVSLHAELLCLSCNATITFRFTPRARLRQFCVPQVAVPSIIVYFSEDHMCGERPASGGPFFF